MDEKTGVRVEGGTRGEEGRAAPRARAAAMLLALLLACLALVAVGCGGDDDEEAAPADTEEQVAPAETEAEEQEQLTIGVSLASPTIPLYVAMADGIREQAEELGVELVFTEANEDPVQQLNDVQDLIARGVDGILISPIDADAAVPAYEQARDGDVVIMSIARNTDPELEDAFIGASWEDYGRQIAEWTCEEAGGEGDIAMIKGPAGASFVEDMATGYQGYMQQECDGMNVVFETNAVPLTPDQGLAAAQDALSAQANVRVIYANNDDLAAGAINALEEQGRSLDEVIVTGFDGTPGALELLREGKLDFTIALRPYHWGQLGLETIVGHLRGEEAEGLVEIETIPLDQETVDDQEEEDLR